MCLARNAPELFLSHSFRPRFTALVHRWYSFDDSYVSPVDEQDVCSSAAYLLFYRRTADMQEEQDQQLLPKLLQQKEQRLVRVP